MSYHLKGRYPARRQLAGDTSHGPSWYQAIGSIASQPPGARLPRGYRATGSLGDDPPADNSLSTPTLTDPATVQWQNNVLSQLQAGVVQLEHGEKMKILQIIATLSIPLAAAVWKMIFKKGASDPTV
jgi:hypothetical protein